MAGMTMGADGGVGSTYNFMAPVIRKVLDYTANGKITEARLHQYHVQQTCKIMCKYGKTRAYTYLSGRVTYDSLVEKQDFLMKYGNVIYNV